LEEKGMKRGEEGKERGGEERGGPGRDLPDRCQTAYYAPGDALELNVVGSAMYRVGQETGPQTRDHNSVKS